MEFNQSENLIITIVQEAEGKYLLPYQVFTRLKQRDPYLGDSIERAHPTQPGKPIMGGGAERYYSPASFVAQALNHFTGKYQQLNKQFLDTKDIEVVDIIPGNKEGTSIWAWRT